jgi:hypothetical protein
MVKPSDAGSSHASSTSTSTAQPSPSVSEVISRETASASCRNVTSSHESLAALECCHAVMASKLCDVCATTAIAAIRGLSSSAPMPWIACEFAT